MFRVKYPEVPPKPEYDALKRIRTAVPNEDPRDAMKRLYGDPIDVDAVWTARNALYDRVAPAKTTIYDGIKRATLDLRDIEQCRRMSLKPGAVNYVDHSHWPPVFVGIDLASGDDHSVETETQTDGKSDV